MTFGSASHADAGNIGQRCICVNCLIGVCITKLFGLLPTEQRLDQLRWLAGSLSAATAIVAMQITATTHPPAGATALLAAINAEVYGIGWYYLPVVLLSSSLVLVSALIINNVARRYPVYWWEPVVPAVLQPPPEAVSEAEKGMVSSRSSDLA
ncbi:HPP family-domain-containing protein [Roridomyces roridus]|uniref:HPP family-domain-containing protein n=1 Tax=Roridomyces roridus TaxID=1738132 RepID=A0AAD7BBK9_9AGAR|nr:HPP family-domain-containing protein [Roridomyces roridus]